MAPRTVTAPALALALAASAGLVAGCGESGRPSLGSESTSSASAGRAVFAEDCSVCHSLDGRDHPSRQGGDLLGFHASRAELSQFVREMPVVRRRLSGDELRAVVAFVGAAERRVVARRGTPP